MAMVTGDHGMIDTSEGVRWDMEVAVCAVESCGVDREAATSIPEGCQGAGEIRPNNIELLRHAVVDGSNNRAANLVIAESRDEEEIMDL